MHAAERLQMAMFAGRLSILWVNHRPAFSKFERKTGKGLLPFSDELRPLLSDFDCGDPGIFCTESGEFHTFRMQDGKSQC